MLFSVKSCSIAAAGQLFSRCRNTAETDRGDSSVIAWTIWKVSRFYHYIEGGIE